MAQDPFQVQFGSMDPGAPLCYRDGDPPALPPRPSHNTRDLPQSSNFQGFGSRAPMTMQSPMGNAEAIPLQSQHANKQKKRSSIGSIFGQAVKILVSSNTAYTELLSPFIPKTQSNVIVNGVQLVSQELLSLQSLEGAVLPGSYWYDRRNGAYGFIGQPCSGVIAAGLHLGGGQLAKDASGKTGTGCFINGRELHTMDIMNLRAIGVMTLQGYWWLDANGTYGLEGSSVPLGNLRLQSMAASGSGQWGYGGGVGGRGGSGGTSTWSTSMGHYGGTDGQGFQYVGGPGWSWSN